MWTTEILSKRIIDRSAVVDVRFTDSLTSTSTTINGIPYDGTLDQLKKRLLAEINQMEQVSAKLEKLDLGVIDLTIDETAEQAKQHYFDLLNKWTRVQEDIKNGLIKADDPSVVQLQIDLKEAYRPEYSGL